LLRHTDPDAPERSALTINPAKTCQPIGAMYAALGVHGCLPHSHGSQGCCAYHRSSLTRHYKEPIMAATSSFTEGSSVFGGQANLLQAIDNIFTIYGPEVIAVHTTCLSETIGDDLTQIVKKATQEGKIPEGKRVIYCNTPSYVGSHITGFSNMVKGMVDLVVEPSDTKTKRLNIIPGWVEPADMREIKSLASRMGVETLMFPDTSDVLDAPQLGKHAMYPKGGVKMSDLATASQSKATIALGEFCSSVAARELETKHGVPCEILDLPIGLKATDRFVDKLRKLGGVKVPELITDERGRLVDLISDMQQYFCGKRVGLVGDPDQLIALSEFMVDLDMKPVYIVTGSVPKRRITRAIEAKVKEQCPDAKIAVGERADMYHFHQLIKNESVDLIIGNTYCKYIAKDEDIPFVRHGFPIYDRIGHQYMPTVGYRGGIRLCEQILSALMDRQDRDTPDESFELVL
ncbi:MAG: nitrogenase molybdenum-iron protein subunit beta, partial [Planctomycetes bacterium]|nr:nitrogenase molybdenum-iron protein subunit beta [Planctomycetota bacterium]